MKGFFLRPIIIIAVTTIAIVMLAATVFASGPVAQYGRLYRDGNKIVGERSGGVAVQLKGPSMQWSTVGWGSDRFFITEAVDAMVDGWNAGVIRVPLGISYAPDNVKDGYDVDPAGNWARVQAVTDRVIERGVYAIVDWHSHTAHNAVETALAIDFFTNPNLAGKYGNNNAVIFEIYNEPVGNISWEVVKAYSEAVIKAVRDAGFNNLILVGTPYWTTQVDVAAADPPHDPLGNFAFVFHFYADIHRIDRLPYYYAASTGKTYRSMVMSALDAGFPVFMSEWGTNDATMHGAPNFAQADLWIAFMDEHKLSGCAWGATSGSWWGANNLDYWQRWGNPLLSDYRKLENWTDPFRMTPHGRYIYRWLTGKDTTTAPISSWPAYSGPSSAIIPASEWWSFAGATSTVVDEPDEGGRLMTYTSAGDEHWVGMGFDTPGGLARCEYGVAYTYRGGAHALQANQSNVDNYDYHRNYKLVEAAVDWTEVRLPWTYFAQREFEGGALVARDSSLVRSLEWTIDGSGGGGPDSGRLWVRDVRCLGDNTSDVAVIPVRSPSKTSARW